MSVLVSGGAGYVGSHAVVELVDRGVDCVVLDNLSRGHRDLVIGAELVVGDVRDSELVSDIVRKFDVEAVLHFAAYAYVGESMSDPGLYYDNNVAASIEFLNSLRGSGVDKIVFSSTCATYGIPKSTPIKESQPQNPVNPYGASKLMVERVLSHYASAYGLNYVVFRYFNAAGADPKGRVGERHVPETHLIPLALEAALGMRPALEVYGTDYDTSDGTCIRDYVHVSDLARAHVLGLEYLKAGNESRAFNLANGSGYSVLEVLDAVESVTGAEVPREFSPRRPGDPAILVGDATEAGRQLDWTPEWTDLEAIVDSAWRWHQSDAAPG